MKVCPEVCGDQRWEELAQWVRVSQGPSPLSQPPKNVASATVPSLKHQEFFSFWSVCERAEILLILKTTIKTHRHPYLAFLLVVSVSLYSKLLKIASCLTLVAPCFLLNPVESELSDHHSHRPRTHTPTHAH